MFGGVFAQSGGSLTGDLDMKAIMTDNVQSLKFDFCDTTKNYFSNGTVSYTQRPGSSNSFCTQLISPSDYTIKSTFVDGSLSDHGTVVCDQNLST
ncbi:TPA: hypothetical protein DEP21_05375 [Patescibacteria group bacterium]|nr:hypothetical protein [Candidatus Gracilibacteria bacterium]